MSDLISRKAVLEEIQKIECEPGYQHVGEDWSVGLIIAENIVESAESIESMPSAEPERTAKVKEKWGLAMCCACKKRVYENDIYCSHCGARLEWNE